MTQNQKQLGNFPSNPGQKKKAANKNDAPQNISRSAEVKQDESQGRSGGMRGEGETCRTSDASEQACN